MLVLGCEATWQLPVRPESSCQLNTKSQLMEAPAQLSDDPAGPVSKTVARLASTGVYLYICIYPTTLYTLHILYTTYTLYNYCNFKRMRSSF